jgi:hypothetical protein
VCVCVCVCVCMWLGRYIAYTVLNFTYHIFHYEAYQ